MTDIQLRRLPRGGSIEQRIGRAVTEQARERWSSKSPDDKYWSGVFRFSLLGIVVSTITLFEAISGQVDWRIWAGALWVAFSCVNLVVSAWKIRRMRSD